MAMGERERDDQGSLMLIRTFEGIDSARGMAWRVADSLGLRWCPGYSLTDRTPDNSTISRNRRPLAAC